MTAPRSAYLHVPFCRHHCGYCNFTVVAGRDDLVEPYLEAIGRELDWLQGPHTLDTLFLGGGSPSHLKPNDLERLLNMIRQTFPLAAGCEWTVEANPEDIHQSLVTMLAEAGVTRISLGVQSFDPAKLRRLERGHDTRQIFRAVDAVRQHDLHLSLDLIFGAPGEAPHVWEKDLDCAVQLGPEHLSTYGLTFEKGTPFFSQLLHGRLQQLDEESERAYYESAIDRLNAAGFEHYEISNFAQHGRRCRHNEIYWLGGAYFGIGPGAARYVDGRRETNHRSVTTYLRRVLSGESPVAESEQLGAEERARERLVFGLRRMEGVQRAVFAAETGFELDVLGGNALQRFLDQKLLEDTGTNIRLTREGLMISDALWPELI